MTPPKPPSSTKPPGGDDNGGETPRLLENLDQMSAEQLADYFYALAEEIIASPREYFLKMGMETIDISEFDNIDLSTPEGRRKLAALFRLLAAQVLSRTKQQYLGSVTDKSKPQGRTR